MVVFKCSQSMTGEEWDRWKSYIEDCYDNDKPVVLPEYIDLLKITDEGEEFNYEEE